jgi:hypothetical protein
MLHLGLQAGEIMGLVTSIVRLSLVYDAKIELPHGKELS